jgi:hypothetical protein
VPFALATGAAIFLYWSGKLDKETAEKPILTLGGFASSTGSQKVGILNIQNGKTPLHDCQIVFAGQKIGKPFNLIADEEKSIPIIKVENNIATPYHKIKNPKIELLLQPITYKLVFLSNDLYPALKKKVKLVYDDNGWQARIK